ncbi:MAG: GNAT family N-acetyltransferase [Patescibacteria group bacterium]|nr:GNAT family N-acetyltransferase [Patescibacteria group bacterium]
MFVIQVRRAVEGDLPRIFEIEKRSYTPQLQATHAVLRRRFNTFGIWVAEYSGVVRGFSTCVPANINWHVLVQQMLDRRKPYYQPWFDAYEQGGEFNTLLVSSTAVETEYQGRGIGTELVKNSLTLANELGLDYRASALRCQYKSYLDTAGNSIEEFLEEVRQGNLKDRFLGLYLKLGFQLGPALPNYEPYSGSCGYNIFAYKAL